MLCQCDLLGLDHCSPSVRRKAIEHFAPSRYSLSSTVLFVDCLAADAEFDRNFLPRPTKRASTFNLQDLQSLGEVPQRPHGAQTRLGVRTLRPETRFRKLHAVNLH